MLKLLKKYKNDFILIGTVLVLAAIIIIAVTLLSEKGETVKIIIDGEEKYSYNLAENNKFTILTGEDDKLQNTVIIEDGKAYMQSANCPDKICVAHRAISKEGQTIVCLPHKLVVAVE